ncbi:MAG: hypothetical protein AAFU56_01165, partial [Pseudomonadota bacterium]
AARTRDVGVSRGVLDVQLPVRGGMKRLADRIQATPLGELGLFGRLPFFEDPMGRKISPKGVEPPQGPSLWHLSSDGSTCADLGTFNQQTWSNDGLLLARCEPG